jgi:membrane protein implicated in regulation of membrane protease activity
VPQTDSPLNRSIGLSGLIRWLIAVGAVVAIGAAFAAGRVALAIAGTVFLVAAVILGYRAWRARSEAGADHSRSGSP